MMRLCCALILSLTLSACVSSWQRGVPIDSLRSSDAAQQAKVIELPVSRKALRVAVDRGARANRIRFVEIFKGARDGGGNGIPEYRMFDIAPGSIYDLVGLKTADSLVAAHGMVVYDTSRFAEYVVKFLPQLPDASIEITRADERILLKYRLID